MIKIEMEMPDKCSECRFQTEYEFCSAMPENFCGVTSDEGKPDWCPLKSDDSWISVKDRLPESGEHVLVSCEIRPIGRPSRKYVCEAFYAGKFTISDVSADDDIAYDYNEEEDEYYLKEGWYECIHNWDEYSSIVIWDFVTHWQNPPEPPKEETSDKA